MKDMTMEEMREYIRLLEIELEEEKIKREKDKEDYNLLEKEYEKEIEDLKRDLINANGKITSQKITLESYKHKVGVPIIIEGAEEDLYRGEQKDFVIGLLRNAMNNSDKYTRTYKICESLLGSNNEIGRRSEIKDKLSTILKSYSGMDSDTISNLESCDVKIVIEKGHHKILLGGDERYTISISHTPSDIKCGLNAMSDINKTFF